MFSLLMSQDGTVNLIVFLGLLFLGIIANVVLLVGMNAAAVSWKLDRDRVFEFCLGIYLSYVFCIFYWYFVTLGLPIEQKHLTGVISVFWLLIILKPEIVRYTHQASFNPTLLFLYGLLKQYSQNERFVSLIKGTWAVVVFLGILSLFVLALLIGLGGLSDLLNGGFSTPTIITAIIRIMAGFIIWMSAHILIQNFMRLLKEEGIIANT